MNMEKKYKISCVNRECGLFSDLVHGILPSIIYLKDNNINYFHVEWKNNLYQNDSSNLYDHFFKNTEGSPESEVLNINNCPYGIFFLHHNTDYLLQRGYDVIKTLNWFDGHFFKNMKIPFNKNEKVLGVQQRKTDHYMETKILPDDELIKKTENELKRNNYDKIFFISDDLDVLELFKNYFGDMVVYNDCIRSKGKTAIHYQKDLLKNNKIKLAEDVMKDSYCLGLTDYKLICNSNVSTFSLLSNYNKNKFEYIDKF